jgi:hypothetical protein
MAIETLEPVQTIRIHPLPRAARQVPVEVFEPNFGPEDMHAIKAIAYIMNSIFVAALLMYSIITLFAWLGS